MAAVPHQRMFASALECRYKAAMARRAALFAVLAFALFGLTACVAEGAESSSPQTLVSSDPDALLKLAKKAGFTGLSECETKLLRSAESGDVADCSSSDPKENDPSKGDKWPRSREIGASLIRWLCVNRKSRKLIDPEGIEINGAKIGDPLNLEFISVPFEIDIEDSRFLSEMKLLGADVGALYLMGTWTGPLDANGLTAHGSVFLTNGFHADGAVDLKGATIGGTLDAEDGTFNNPNGYALNADSIDVKGSLFLRDKFSATGEVNLVRATIGANLDAEDGTFNNPNGYALNADGIDVNGHIFLRNEFSATGEVNLVGATVGGQLDASNATFNKPKGYALNASGIDVKGTVFLNDKFSATGKVNLAGATVGGDLTVYRASFGPGSWFEGTSAKVDRTFWWTGITAVAGSSKGASAPLGVTLDLADASAGTFRTDKSSWAPVRKVYLNGFKYDRLQTYIFITYKTGLTVPVDWTFGRNWIRLQNTKTSLPTPPYEQLAGVLASQGDDYGSRQIAIAMEDDLRDSRAWYTRGWPWILDLTIGYGYEPWRALWWALGLVFFGYITFGLGYRAGVVAPTDSDAFKEFKNGKLPIGYQSFNAFVYSLDTFLPIINLGLKNKWIPDPQLHPRPNALTGTWVGDLVGAYLPRLARCPLFTSGRVLRTYFWCHLLLGWVLITFVVAGLTGIVHH